MLKKFKSGFAVGVNFIMTGDVKRGCKYYYDVLTNSLEKSKTVTAKWYAETCLP